MNNVSWEFTVQFKRTKFNLKAVVEYYSKQVIRIRLTGSGSSILLETNYSAVYHRPSKMGGIKWQIKEGKVKEGTPETARFFVDIFSNLEYRLKQDIKKLFPDPPLAFE